MSRCCRLVLLASLGTATACGSVKDQAGALPDAAIPTDDAPVTPVRGTVHVTVLEPAGTGNPAVGATVVFVDADGTVTKKTTDTAGKTSADLLPGANATSIVLVNTAYTMQTVLALQPGDDITLGDKSVDNTSPGSLTVSVPLYSGAAYYYLTTPCGAYYAPVSAASGLPTATITPYNYCQKSPFEMVVVAEDSTGTFLSSFNVPTVSFIVGQTYSYKGPYTGLQSVTASYSNIDASVTSLTTSRIAPDLYGFGAAQAVALGGTTGSATVASGMSTKAVMITSVSSAKGLQTIRQPIAGTASTYGVDLAATLLPWISLPTYDAASNKLVVPVDTTGTTNDKPDMFSTDIRYVRTDANQTVTASFDWRFYAPAIADIALPALPSDLATLLPTATDTVSFRDYIAFDAASLDGYDAVRNNPKAAFDAYASSRPADTNIRITGQLVRK